MVRTTVTVLFRNTRAISLQAADVEAVTRGPLFWEIRLRNPRRRYRIWRTSAAFEDEVLRRWARRAEIRVER